eukprot:1845103-Amphidinium_carterae.1
MRIEDVDRLSKRDPMMYPLDADVLCSVGSPKHELVHPPTDLRQALLRAWQALPSYTLRSQQFDGEGSGQS